MKRESGSTELIKEVEEIFDSNNPESTMEREYPNFISESSESYLNQGLLIPEQKLSHKEKIAAIFFLGAISVGCYVGFGVLENSLYHIMNGAK